VEKVRVVYTSLVLKDFYCPLVLGEFFSDVVSVSAGARGGVAFKINPESVSHNPLYLLWSLFTFLLNFAWSYFDTHTDKEESLINVRKGGSTD
jgi:hypothetical protein